MKRFVALLPPLLKRETLKLTAYSTVFFRLRTDTRSVPTEGVIPTKLFLNIT